MKFKDVEILLSKLKEVQKPKLRLEQYTIPGNLATKILNIAYLSGDVKDKFVVDFGCGSGRLAIGAALLKAKKVVGVDIDKDVLRIAKLNVKLAEDLSGQKISDIVRFVCMNVRDWNFVVDTIIQNPPFGIQSEGLDLLFLEKALKSARVVYSLHRGPEARGFLKRFIEEKDGKIVSIHTFKFPIPHMFKFHRKPKVKIDVDLYVIRTGLR